MSESRVTLNIIDGVADVRLNRPDKLNALDPAMFAALRATIARLGDEDAVRAVVLSGNGRAFSAGLDLSSMAGGVNLDAVRARDHGDANGWQQVAWGWRTLAVPVIAAVHGVAFGGGLQIIAGADVRIAAPDARMAVRELEWGIVPDMAGFTLWRGTVRDDVLRELVYTARAFDAGEGQALGFVTRLADDPYTAAWALARTIAEQSAAAIRAAKRLANLSADAGAAAILLAESTEQAHLLGTPEQRATAARRLRR